VNIGRFRLQKKYLAFFTVVPLLFISAFVEVPCPVCQATGNVSNSGMYLVTVEKLEAETSGIYLAWCGMYRVYITDINVELLNSSDKDVNGYLSLVLSDYTKGSVLDNQYVVVNIPAKNRLNASYSVYFQVSVDDPQTVKIDARPVIENVPDRACDGTGVVTANEWPLWAVMKTSIIEAHEETVTEPQFIPIFLPPEDWDDPYAYPEIEVEEYE